MSRIYSGLENSLPLMEYFAISSGRTLSSSGVIFQSSESAMEDTTSVCFSSTSAISSDVLPIRNKRDCNSSNEVLKTIASPSLAAETFALFPVSRSNSITSAFSGTENTFTVAAGKVSLRLRTKSPPKSLLSYSTPVLQIKRTR